MDTTTSAQHSTASIDAMGPITAVHIALMVVLALAALLIIWRGGVLVRRRRRAERQVAENREIAEEAGATAPPTTRSPMGDDVPAVPAAPPRPAPEPASERVPEPAPAPAREPAPEPAPVAPPAPAPASTSAGGSDLTQLKGLGPKLAATLAELGYTRLDQIADLTPAEAEALDARLGAFQGRMARDRWIEQARLLVAGDRAAYEAQFGKL
ncbi:hypothetical protein [Sphingomonas sp. NFR15]|uniref:hypothetical protein n=1 Tax=Sphingomonas sp. NFR15 TaxID=1566282 RepID=UPI000880305B|nr:hypothetical protein [Sphingomonas sp. NFR15]SDA34115.1 Predicted 5' DNA nuclease, flap endonuclease-1-like, helix-3-turn-helix (H3TH) domain [Sphingomonas sp. NFR15]